MMWNKNESLFVARSKVIETFLCLWFHSIEHTFGSWFIFETRDRSAHASERDVGTVPTETQHVLVKQPLLTKQGPQTE